MQQIHTTAIILRRINYGEADRIITVLTPDHGKVVLMAKGVRKSTSKLAGGIELMSESEISFIKGRGEIDTLTSTKLVRHFAGIAGDYDRLTTASQFMKRLDACTEVDPHAEYYHLALDVMLLLNSPQVSSELADAWGTLRLLFALGEVPNLQQDANGAAFSENTNYVFSYESSNFTPAQNGDVTPTLIKFLRLLITHPASASHSVKGSADLAKQAAKITNLLYTYHRPVMPRS